MNDMWTPELGASAFDSNGAAKLLAEAEKKRCMSRPGWLHLPACPHVNGSVLIRAGHLVRYRVEEFRAGQKIEIDKVLERPPPTHTYPPHLLTHFPFKHACCAVRRCGRRWTRTARGRWTRTS